MQLTFSLQAPHWHEICVPTRLTSSLSICASVCAQITAVEAATNRKRRLSFNRNIRFCNTYYFGARIRARHFARNQTHERPADQHHYPDPDPGDQREHIGLQRGFIAYAGGVVNVEVFVQTRPERDFRRALLCDLIEPPGGFQNPERFAVFRNFEDGGVPLIIGCLALRETGDLQRVPADLHGVALVDFADGGLIEGMAAPADEHQDDTHVNQIAAVAPRVAMRQLDHRRDQSDTGLLADGPGAAEKLHDDGRHHEEAESKR